MITGPSQLTPLSGSPLRRRGGRGFRLALLFVTGVVLADGVFGDRGVAGTIRARQAYRRASASLAKLKEENAGLREQARRLQQDPSTIEALARRDLGLIKPGEILVVVTDLK